MKRKTPSFIIAALATCTLGTGSVLALDLYRNPSSGGNWSASLWATTPGGPYNQPWTPGATAIFEGARGTVTVDGGFSVGGIDFAVPYTSGSTGSTLSGGTLNFTPGAKIRTNDNRWNNTITSAITGSPAVETKDFGAGNTYEGLKFEPGTGSTQTLGAILNPNNTGTTDKAGIYLGGSTSGNSVASISYAGGDHYGTVYKTGSGTWTTGGINTGTLRISAGKLILNGVLTEQYGGLVMSGSGVLAGEATLNKSDRRSARDFVSGTGIAPGHNGIGTITFNWGTNATPNETQWTTAFRAGSTYEWELGAGSRDIVHVTNGRLVLEGFTLKIIDAGGSPDALDQFPVLTYGSLDSKTLSLDDVQFDTTLAPDWGANGARLVDDGAGTIFLTGLSPAPVPFNPYPAYGTVVPGGEVTLTWTNLAPNSGGNVWVDVWFGSDPNALVKVADAASDDPNRTSVTVTAGAAGNWYWRVDSYLDGSPSGTPVQGTAFIFVVNDSVGDGIPDAWKAANFTDWQNNPDSAAAADPDGDDKTNLEEYLADTKPNKPDSDNDGLLDGGSIAVGSGDPRYSAWAADIVFTDNAGQRTFRGENEMGTEPLDPDTDGDGLPDGVETHTGVWVSVSNTGTDPTHSDTDRDALPDGAETHTGVFVSLSNTGTNPNLADTDGDGAGDWYEIAASFTDPFIAASKPGVPYPLPDPDGLSGASDKPVKVYIMSGQSNMVGFGTVSGTEEKTLQTMTVGQNKFPDLIDESGAWTTRQDVRYRGVISDFTDAQLSPGALGSGFGPELGFGYVMGWYHDEPVLLLKSCTGNRSLGWDVLPPGSVSYVYGSTNYGGYGDWGNWPVGGVPPTSGGWYAGKEFDRFFMHEDDWVHADPADFNVVDVLDNWAAQYPQWAAQGFEIAGFVWWQGDKDRYDMGHATRYEQNLVKLITTLRSYYENRYPGEENQFPLGRVAPNAPFVLATLGQTPLGSTNEAEKAILDAQLAVDGESGRYSQFAGNVKTVYAHPLSEGGASNSHYDGRAGTYMLIGDALGRAMAELQGTVTPPSGGYADWTIGPFSGSLTDPDPALDFDAGGLATALEWVLGGDPTDPGDDTAIAPTLDNHSDPDFFIFTHRRNADAAADAGTAIKVEYGSDLGGWTEAVAGPDIVVTPDPDGAGAGIDLVEVKIRRTLAAAGKFFARLKVAVATP
jgi:hypothetical protein